MITCRTDLKNYCLRKLGAPALQINVTPEQIEDRIDDALKRYWEFHHEGSYRDFIMHKITQENLDTKSITVDEWVYSVLNVMMLGSTFSNLNLEYQSIMQTYGTKLNTFGDGLVNYTVAESYLQMVRDFFGSHPMLRFNQRHNIVHIDSSLLAYSVNDILVLEVYRFSDPNKYRETWDDWWLKDYATALIKKQWGQNMSKYIGFQLPSGITLDGSGIFQDALREIEDLENKLFSSETLPPDFMIG